MAKKSFNELLDEALKNAREDRDKAEKAYENMKEALSGVETPEQKEAAMLAGPVAVKLLEQLTKANEQIVRLVQVKEKQDSKDKSKGTPINISDVINAFEDDEKDKEKIN